MDDIDQEIQEAMRCNSLQQELSECLTEAERLRQSTTVTLSILRGQQDE